MKTKKMLKGIMIGIVVAVAVGIVSCSNSSISEGSTLDKEVLVVGMDDAFAPMGFKDQDGNITGFDVDLAKALGEKLNKEIKFQPIDWTMKETELDSGNIDLIWNGYTITEERKGKVTFSVPYLKNRQVIVTLSNSEINSKADLSGKKVGAQDQSSAVSAMEKDDELYKNFYGGKAITFEDNNQALMDLEAGRIDAVVADEILVRYYIELKGEGKYKILKDDFGDEEYGVGIRKGDDKMIVKSGEDSLQQRFFINFTYSNWSSISDFNSNIKQDVK